jgi:hypothetical protein
MATFNLTLTYPDGQGPRIMAALKAQVPGVGANPTNAQAIEWLRKQVANQVKRIVREYEAAQAVQVVTDTDVT